MVAPGAGNCWTLGSAQLTCRHPVPQHRHRSTFSYAVLHADETPVAILKPGNKKTQRAYVWAYAAGHL